MNTLHAATGLRSTRTRADKALLPTPATGTHTAIEVVNQNDDPVMTMIAMNLIRRRPQPADP